MEKKNHKIQNNAKEKKTALKSWLLGFKVLLVLVQLIVSVLLVVSIVNTGLIGELTLGIVIVSLAALFAISCIWLLVRYKATSVTAQVICIVLSVVVIIGGFLAMNYTDAFNGFLAKVTEPRPEMKQYGVLVLDKSEIQGIDELQGRSVGFLKADPKAVNAERKLAEVVEIDADFYEDMNTLIETLNGGISEAIVLETDRIEMLRESPDGIKTIDEATRVVYYFEIELGDEQALLSNKEVTSEPFVVYISGSDSRNGVKATARSDVNIVAAVNPKEAKILLVSIPRDTYVQLHGTTGIKDKLTHAGVYGIDMSRMTIEDFLGINIDYTIKVSFDTVVKVVDQLIRILK